MPRISRSLVSSHLHALSLAFRNQAREREYREYSTRRLLVQARVALVLGLALYSLVGVLDSLFIPEIHRASAWVFRLGAMSYAVAVFALTFHPLFARFNQLPIALIGPDATLGLIGVMLLMPAHVHALYFTAVVIVVFWTYLALGIRFIYGLAMNVVIIAIVYGALGIARDIEQTFFAASAFFLLAASIIAGGTSYVIEFQQRLLFLRREQLALERERHRARSLHDPLTGLPNRELLYDRIEQAVAHAQREGVACAGLYMDLDGFKLVNDTHGHAAGDQTLKVVSERLGAIMRPGDTLARMGGDEFFVLARGISAADAAGSLADRMLRVMEEPVPFGAGKSADVGISIGVCLFPFPGCTVEKIIQRADDAMYSVKRRGKRGRAFASAASLPAEQG